MDQCLDVPSAMRVRVHVCIKMVDICVYGLFVFPGNVCTHQLQAQHECRACVHIVQLYPHQLRYTRLCLHTHQHLMTELLLIITPRE